MTLVALLLTFILAWYVQTLWVFYIWWSLSFFIVVGRYLGAKK